MRRGELLGLLVLVALAGWFRFAGLGHVGLTHFDEGVYVLWGMGLGYPGQEFFAPPLFPLLLSAWFRLLGPSDLAALALNASLGTATVPLVWWVSRRWYGPAAGLSSAAMAACSDYHITFSRMALTDTSFGFWVVLSLAAASQLFECCRSSNPVRHDRSAGKNSLAGWLWAAVFGLAAGAALNTKYNGFLVLALAFAPLVHAGLVRTLRASLAWNRVLILLATAAFVALLLYLPWAEHIASRIGYADLLRHQRGYTTGLASWPNNLLAMFANQNTLTGWRARAGVVLGGMIPISMAVLARRLSWIDASALAGYVIAIGLAVGDAAGWTLGVLPVVAQVWQRREIAVLHVVWLLGLILLTPFYSPYARLLVPLVAAGWVAGGHAMAALSEAISTRSSDPRPGWRWVLAAGGWIAGVLAVIWCARWWNEPPLNAEYRPSLRDACEQLARSIPKGQRAAIFVRPPVLFYLLREGRASDLLASLDMLRSPSANRPKYLVIDSAILRDNPQAGKLLREAAPQLNELIRVPYQASLPVLLDDWGWRGRSEVPNYSLILYEVSLRSGRLE